jgi:hypothetical protein
MDTAGGVFLRGKEGFGQRPLFVLVIDIAVAMPDRQLVVFTKQPPDNWFINEIS